MDTQAHPDDDEWAFPQPQTPASRAARAAREKASAAERAKRWRDDQRDRAAIDAAIVTGIGRAFGLRKFIRGVEAGKQDAAITLRTIIDESAKAYRNAGGRYEDGAILVGARLQPLIDHPIRRT